MTIISGCVRKPNRGNSETEPIPKRYEAVSAVQLIWEPFPDEPDEYFLNFINVRLLNPTSSAIRFQGYSSISPWYRIQRWIDGAWVEHRVGWFCGTGLDQFSIPSDRSSVIPVDVTDDLFPIRVGVEYSNDRKVKADMVVWSEKIDH
ncbi:hypothetical protein OAM01_03080 [bacterium]|nr:hypothetical protein [bacterium]